MDYVCDICGELTLHGSEYLDENICDKCVEMLQLDLTIDFVFALRSVGIE